MRSTELRLALANIHRPGSVTPSLVLSLGLGLALLVTLALIDSNLRRQLTASLPERAPSFFFVDIPNAEAGRFDAFIKTLVPDGELTRVPMMRGRLVSLGGRPVETIQAPQNVAWVLSGDRGITYAEAPPAGSRVVEGEWWTADRGRAAGVDGKAHRRGVRPQDRRRDRRQRAGAQHHGDAVANLRTRGVASRSASIS